MIFLNTALAASPRYRQTSPASNLVFSAVGENQFTVDWTAGVNVNDTETLQYRVSGASIWSNAASTTGTTSTISGLTAETSYEVRVRSTDLNTGGYVYSTIFTQATSAPVNTSLLQSPNNFSDSIWRKAGGVVIQNTGLADPEGGMNATQIYVPSNSLGVYQLVEMPVAVDDRYTISVWLRLVSGSTGQINIGFNGRTKANNNRGDGNIFLTGEWKKYSYTLKVIQADTGLFGMVCATTLSGGSSNLPEITVQVYGAKIEAGYDAT